MSLEQFQVSGFSLRDYLSYLLPGAGLLLPFAIAAPSSMTWASENAWAAALLVLVGCYFAGFI